MIKSVIMICALVILIGYIVGEYITDYLYFKETLEEIRKEALDIYQDTFATCVVVFSVYNYDNDGYKAMIKELQKIQDKCENYALSVAKEHWQYRQGAIDDV